ncbi:MAG TPA: hypothetical protein VE954_25645 [Oligoflexus sp.]|uniref:hypothetical protein n=1 Tax=Oligoflexus sp. TaxID=1971216 RepID=UPI002D4ED080|nr:hypothetical protein [Oligoflexus sp.]HYX36506.1 hypothetical protein [Oligoflexus sp.]
MTKSATRLRMIMSLLSAFYLNTACTTPRDDSGSTAVPASPYAYCEKVRTMDSPEAVMLNSANTEEIVQALKRGRILDASANFTSTDACRWRCMDGSVYACCTGANLPCDVKADTSRTPSHGMTQYCTENPNTPSIPAYATGRATVYLWKCSGTTPVADKQVLQLDKRGYQVDFWHRVGPG